MADYEVARGIAPDWFVEELAQGEREQRRAARARQTVEEMERKRVSRRGQRPPRLLVEGLAHEEGKRYGEPFERVLSQKRRGSFKARCGVIYRLRLMGYSLPGIGLAFGVDHSSISHALTRYAEFLAEENRGRQAGHVQLPHKPSTYLCDKCGRVWSVTRPICGDCEPVVADVDSVNIKGAGV